MALLRGNAQHAGMTAHTTGRRAIYGETRRFYGSTVRYGATDHTTGRRAIYGKTRRFYGTTGHLRENASIYGSTGHLRENASIYGSTVRYGAIALSRSSTRIIPE